MTGQWACGQRFVDHAMAGNCGKCRCALGTENDKIGLLRTALIKQLFSRIARHHYGLDGDLALQISWNQGEHAAFDFIEGTAGEEFSAILWTDNVLQNQAGLMLRGKLGGKSGQDRAGLMQADGAKNGARGKVAITTVNDIRADDEDRRSGGAQYRFGHRTYQ